MRVARGRTLLCQKEGDGPESQEPSPNNHRGVLPVQDDAAVAVTDFTVYKAGSIACKEQYHLCWFVWFCRSAKRYHGNNLCILFLIFCQ